MDADNEMPRPWGQFEPVQIKTELLDDIESENVSHDDLNTELETETNTMEPLSNNDVLNHWSLLTPIKLEQHDETSQGALHSIIDVEEEKLQQECVPQVTISQIHVQSIQDCVYFDPRLIEDTKKEVTSDMSYILNICKTSMEKEVKSIRCNFCRHTFDKNWKRYRHIREKHSKNMLFCDLCKYKTRLKVNLKYHLTKMHFTEIKEAFPCILCGKRLNCKYSLKTHLSTVHCNERNFPCNACPQTFKKKGDLSRHIKVVHFNIRAFPCNICNKSFKRFEALRAHQYVHSDIQAFKCEKCNKLFKTKSNLQDHDRYVHSDVFAFQCTICARQFKRNKDLNSHLRQVHKLLTSFKL